ncbi:MAG: hypothetical protein D6702_08005 [Planctomycetota bacterium]|nr:MAG: hypothetical protein D6702_08005 [Planctomycetota bacterium]
MKGGERILPLLGLVLASALLVWVLLPEGGAGARDSDASLLQDRPPLPAEPASPQDGEGQRQASRPPAPVDRSPGESTREERVLLAREGVPRELEEIRARYTAAPWIPGYLDQAFAGPARQVGEYGPLQPEDFPGLSDPLEMWGMATTIALLARNTDQWDVETGAPADSAMPQVLEGILQSEGRSPGMRIVLPLEATVRRFLGPGQEPTTEVRQQLREIWVHRLRDHAMLTWEIHSLHDAAVAAAERAGLQESPLPAELLDRICPDLAQARARMEALEAAFLADVHTVLSVFH